MTRTPHQPAPLAANAANAAAAADREVWIDGRFVPAGEASVSVFDHGLLYGDGVFEGIRSYNGRIFKLDTHLKRLYDSAKAIRLDIQYSAQQLAEACRELVQRNGVPNGYIRLVATRGGGPLGLNPFICKNAAVFIIADTIRLYPQEMYDHGMEIITAATIRNHPAAISPRIKSLNYLNNILAKIEAIDAGVPEAVMLNHQGHVSECTGDNIFIVRRAPSDGEPMLMSPPLHAGVLEGVTMNTVIGLARDAGIKIVHTDLTKYDLYTADEMFLTGTAAEIIAVTRIDGRSIGWGKPGPVTQQLNRAFRQFVENNCPED